MNKKQSIKLTLRILIVIIIISAYYSPSLLLFFTFEKMYWGYWLKRPELPKEVYQISKVNALIPVMTECKNNNEKYFILDHDYSIEQNLKDAKADPYYNLEERLLFFLIEEDLMPNTLTYQISYPLYYDLVKETDIFKKTQQTNYHKADYLKGLIAEIKSKQNEDMVIMCLRGGQVENDHYPYYELVFIKNSKNKFELVNSQMFYFDIAGLEGRFIILWFIVFLQTVLALVIITVVLFLIHILKKLKNTQKPEG